MHYARRLTRLTGLLIFLGSSQLLAQPPSLEHFGLERLPAVGPEPVADPEPVAEDIELDATVDSPEAGGLWMPAASWFRRKIWSGSVELGINGAAGNSESFSLTGGGDLVRKTERSKLEVELDYNKTHANSVETQHNALQMGRYEWLFADSPWTLFALERAVYDEFRAFDLRLILNAGVGYRLVDLEYTQLTGRFGSGVSREFGGLNDRWSPEASFGADFEHQITPLQKLTATLDYYPEWGDFRDYRLFSEMAWELVLHEASNLSLKLSVVDRYDSTPDGRKPNDINYAVLLLWKL